MSGFGPPWNGRFRTPKRSFVERNLNVAEAPIPVIRRSSGRRTADRLLAQIGPVCSVGAGYAQRQHPNVTSSSVDRMSEASYRGTFLNRPASPVGKGPIRSYMDRNSRMAVLLADDRAGEPD
jgi:hypothetical protein